MPEASLPLFIQNGYLGVDLFFILSGFILAHVYGPQIEDKHYSHGSFIWARLSRIYPLHITAFLMVFALFLIAKAMHFQIQEQAFRVWQIPYHILLLQAWGFVDSDGWNFPSWSISAEWFAYLTFPISFYVASKFRNVPIMGLIFILGLFMLLYKILAFNGLELTSMTWDGGALRIIPSFLAGAVLWTIGRDIKLNEKTTYIGLAIALIWFIISTAFLKIPYLVWPSLVGIVFFLAETSKYEGNGILGSMLWVYLGEISFAMYMFHLPIDITFYKLIDRIMPNMSLGLSIVIMILAFISVTIFAAISHELIEKKARNFLRKNIPSFLSGRKDVYNDEEVEPIL